MQPARKLSLRGPQDCVCASDWISDGVLALWDGRIRMNPPLDKGLDLSVVQKVDYDLNMKLSLSLCFVLMILAGCAADTMRKYVGQDIRAVELDYGPPINQIDLGGGTRAYQWQKISVDTTPATAVTTTDKDQKGRKTTSTQFVGGDQTVNTCLYTFITAWDPRRNGWVVTGFREPSFDCAIGGLS